MKEEKQAEIDRKREITKERQVKAAEKHRLEEMAKRVSLSRRKKCCSIDIDELTSLLDTR